MLKNKASVFKPYSRGKTASHIGDGDIGDGDYGDTIYHSFANFSNFPQKSVPKESHHKLLTK